MKSNITSLYLLDCHFSFAAALFGEKKRETEWGRGEEKEIRKVSLRDKLHTLKLLHLGTFKKGMLKYVISHIPSSDSL